MNKQQSAADRRANGRERKREHESVSAESERERHGMNGNEMWTAVGFVPSGAVWGGGEGEGFSKLVTYLRAFIVIWGSRRWAAFTDNWLNTRLTDCQSDSFASHFLSSRALSDSLGVFLRPPVWAFVTRRTENILFQLNLRACTSTPSHSVSRAIWCAARLGKCLTGTNKVYTYVCMWRRWNR